MLFSCEKEKTTPPQAEGEQAEAIVALNANEITRHSAKLWGQIDPSELLRGEEFGILLSTKKKASETDFIRYVIDDLDAENRFHVVAEDHEFGTTYYYRAFYTKKGNEKYSETLSFKTASYDEDVVTLEPEHITLDYAILRGYVNPSFVGKGMEFGVIISTSENPSLTNGKLYVGKELNDRYIFSVKEDNLEMGKKFYYRAFINQNNRYSFGEVKTFAPRDLLESEAIIRHTINQSQKTVEIMAYISPSEMQPGVQFGFELSGRNKYGFYLEKEKFYATDVNADECCFSLTLKDLKANATYTYRAFLKSKDGTLVYLGWFTDFTPTWDFSIIAVDLGLSVYWANANVGAVDESDWGNFYAWGETEPKSDYGWYNYKYAKYDDKHLTKYNYSAEYGIVDDNDSLDREDDVTKTMYGKLLIPIIPNEQQWEELFNMCSKEWVSQDGVNGMRFTGPNGNSIFIPASGMMYEEQKMHHDRGFYWARELSTTRPSLARTAEIGRDEELDLYARTSGYERAMGLSVRAVYFLRPSKPIK